MNSSEKAVLGPLRRWLTGKTHLSDPTTPTAQHPRTVLDVLAPRA
ncbi:MAG: hypothetical protein WCF12_05255 [Propionicimonas sp.]